MAHSRDRVLTGLLRAAIVVVGLVLARQVLARKLERHLETAVNSAPLLLVVAAPGLLGFGGCRLAEARRREPERHLGDVARRCAARG